MGGFQNKIFNWINGNKRQKPWLYNENDREMLNSNDNKDIFSSVSIIQRILNTLDLCIRFGNIPEHKIIEEGWKVNQQNVKKNKEINLNQ